MLLRHRGDRAAADALEAGVLAAQLRTLNPGNGGADPGMTTRLNAIFAAERERILNAAALAEVLAPLLADALSLAMANVGASVSPVAAVVRQRSTPASGGASVSPETESKSRVRVPPPDSAERRTAAPEIADFIDEMIAQERASAPPARRVS